MKAVFRRKFIALNTYINLSQTQNLTLFFKKLKKEEQSKLKANRRNNKEISEIENRERREKKLKVVSLRDQQN